MKRKISKCLVIDASVLIAAGGEGATDPGSIGCTDSLLSVYRNCHKAFVTDRIRSEWDREGSDKKPSGFSKTWRRWMHSHGKFVFSNRSLEDENLRGKITDVAPDSKSRSGMLKDVHLVEAAFAADRIIISCDKTVEEAFAGASAIIHRLQEIIWVNPKIDTQSVLEWLRKGAKREKRRTLGFDADAPT